MAEFTHHANPKSGSFGSSLKCESNLYYLKMVAYSKAVRDFLWKAYCYHREYFYVINKEAVGGNHKKNSDFCGVAEFLEESDFLQLLYGAMVWWSKLIQSKILFNSPDMQWLIRPSRLSNLLASKFSVVRVFFEPFSFKALRISLSPFRSKTVLHKPGKCWNNISVT